MPLICGRGMTFQKIKKKSNIVYRRTAAVSHCEYTRQVYRVLHSSFHVEVIKNCDMKFFQSSDLFKMKEFQFVSIKAYNDIFRRIY